MRNFTSATRSNLNIAALITSKLKTDQFLAWNMFWGLMKTTATSLSCRPIWLRRNSKKSFLIGRELGWTEKSVVKNWSSFCRDLIKCDWTCVETWSAIDEPRDKQSFFDTTEAEKIKRNQRPNQWLRKNFAQIYPFQYRLFSGLVDLETTNVLQFQIYSLFLKNFLRFNYPRICHPTDQNAFQEFRNFFLKTGNTPLLESR